MGILAPDSGPIELGVWPEEIVPNGRMMGRAQGGRAMIRCLGCAVLP